MNRKLSYKISLVQFVLSILIVLLHSNCDKSIGWINDGTAISKIIFASSKIISITGHMAVPMYYVISAYLFYYNVENLSEVRKKIQKRITSLLIPYICWNTLVVIFFWVVLNSPLAHYMHMPNNLTSLNTIVFSILNSEFTPLWFVKNLIIYTACSPLIFLLSKSRIAGILMLVLSCFVVFQYQPNYYSPLYWLPLFIQGVLLSKYPFNIIFKSPFTNISNCFCMLLFMLLFMYTYQTNNLTIYRMIIPIILWKIIDIIPLSYNNHKPHIWTYSFFIYCIHFLLINLYQKSLALFLDNSNISYVLIYISTPLVIIPCCIALARILENRCNSLYKILNGSR